MIEPQEPVEPDETEYCAWQDQQAANGNTSPSDCSACMIAFVQGVAWWEYHQTKATMWQSDRRFAEEEAARREQNGTLGVLPNGKDECLP